MDPPQLRSKPIPVRSMNPTRNHMRTFAVAFVFFCFGLQVCHHEYVLHRFGGSDGDGSVFAAPSLPVPETTAFTASEATALPPPVMPFWSTLPEKKGYGVVYCTYSIETEKTLPRFLKEASESAKLLKENNPTIQTAIITNAESVPPVFDEVVRVSPPFLFHESTERNDGMHRQWFTRLYYLAHSPFRITWSVDSHVAFFTKKLDQAFREFDHMDIDIATANSVPGGYYCHNFSILFRWNDRIKSLFLDWILRQLERGIGTDDQGPLCKAMACAGEAYGLKYGRIAPRWSLAWLSVRPGENNVHWRHRTTQVVQGAPQVCHSRDVCEVAANSSSTKPRVLYRDSKLDLSHARSFYSQQEIDNSKVLPFSYEWHRWDENQSAIVSPTKKACPARSIPLRKNQQPQQPPQQQQQQQQHQKQQHAFSSSKYKKKDSDSIQRLSKVFPPAEPKISLTHAGLSSGLDCGDSPRGVDGIQIHVLGWRRVKGIQRLLTQLQIADYKGWTMDIPLYVHLDGESSDEVQEIVKAFNWTHGPKMEDFRTENVGLREMWITSIGAAAKEAGVNTLMVIFEDDIVVSPAYFQWLLAMVDRYARNPGCRDANLVGFSLSPLAYQEMYLPFHPWDADIAVQERYNSTKEYNSPRVPAYLSAVPSSWGAAYWTDRWMDFDRFVRPRMQPPFFDEAADNVTVRPYSDRKMSPKYLHIPGGYFNFWTKSWKRFMIDIMYVRGWVMMYPNLIDHKGLASSAQDDGIHGSNSTNNRFGADLLDAFELEKEGTLPPYDRLAIFGLDFQPRSKELLLAIGKNFLDNVTNHCTNSSCHKLLEVWDANPGSQHPPVPGSPGSPGSPGIPLTCVADVYTSAGAYHDKPVSMASLSSSSSTGRWLVFDPDTTDKSRLEQAASWAKALNRTLLLPPSMPGGVLGINASVSFFGSLPSDADARPWRNLIVGKQSSATTSSWLDGSSTSALHSVDVRHLFGEVSMSLSVLQHYFGGCSDTMLAFRGAW